MAKTLVTGATGFVGSHIARALVEAGHEVRVLHRQSSKLTALAGLPYESCIGELLDEEALREACTGCDWVFHVAAVADYWQAEYSRMVAVNVEGTRRILRAARDTGVKRVIFTSSGAAVGFNVDGSPADESLDYNLRPDEFPYGWTKMLAEYVARNAVQQFGQDIVILNPVIVLGPGDLNLISGRFITEMARLQWTIPVSSGSIAVVDVRDVARWHLVAAEQGRRGERYILGTANYRLLDWYTMCAQVVKVAPPFLQVPKFVMPLVANGIDLLQSRGVQLPVDAAQARLGTQPIRFDYRKAHTELGAPQFSMYQSLQDTYTWYRDNGYIQPSLLSRLIGGVGLVLGR